MKTLVPAYGRDYKSVKEVYAGLATGHEFEVVDIMSGGGYTTQRELLAMGEKRVIVRYKNKRSCAVVGLPAPGTKNAGYTVMELLLVLGFLAQLTLVGLAIYVAAHFIQKFW